MIEPPHPGQLCFNIPRRVRPDEGYISRDAGLPKHTHQECGLIFTIPKTAVQTDRRGYRDNGVFPKFEAGISDPFTEPVDHRNSCIFRGLPEMISYYPGEVLIRKFLINDSGIGLSNFLPGPAGREPHVSPMGMIER